MAAMITDADVLLRLITRAPEPLFLAARDFLLKAEKKGQRVQVHPLHVAEAVYMLEGRVYGLNRNVAARELLTLLEARVFEPVDGAVLVKALRAYPEAGLDFPHVFLLAWAEEYGGQVISFDRGLQDAGMMVLNPVDAN